jgi:hypothetical protein
MLHRRLPDSPNRHSFGYEAVGVEEQKEGVNAALSLYFAYLG